MAVMLFLKEMYLNASVSSQKLQSIDVSTPKQSEPLNGNRIIDMEILSKVFEVLKLPCMWPIGLKTEWTHVDENGTSLLIICSMWMWLFVWLLYVKEFSSQQLWYKQKDGLYDACMWPGVCWIRKFTAFMNMPKPMTANNYDKIVSQVTECVKSVRDKARSQSKLV